MKNKICIFSLILVFFVLSIPINRVNSIPACSNLYQQVMGIKSLFQTDENGLIQYPTEFGGMYIADGVLKIQIVKGYEKYERKYLHAVEKSSKVKIEYVDYSYRELQEIAKEIDKLCEDYEVTAHGIRSSANARIIHVTDNDYRRLCSNDTIRELGNRVRIEQSGVSQKSSTSLKGGMSIDDISSLNSSSLGIGGTYSSQPSVLSCGHGKYTNDSIRYSGTTFGRVSYARANTNAADYTINSYGDFSIIRITNTQFSRTNIVKSSPTDVAINGVATEECEGMEVYKYGAATQYAIGTIYETDMTLYYPNETNPTYVIRGLTMAYMYNATQTDAVRQGDSGGPVYTYDEDTSKYLLCGTISGYEVPATGCIHYMYYSPIGYATNIGFSILTQ